MMRRLNLLIGVGALATAGCVTPPGGKTAEAIDLCGSVGKLQAANTYYMSDVQSLLVDGKSEQKITYPELTPELRASAMRSTSHCINLHLGKITAERYDKLMSLEATNAAAAENSLTSEQLETLMVKGYKKVADILREAGVSQAAVDKVAAANKADIPPPDRSGQLRDNAESQAFTDINTKVSELAATLKHVPAEVVKALNGVPRPAVEPHEKALIKVLFLPSVAVLDSAALLALHKSIQEVEPDVQLSVVGSADAKGDELRNMELSRQRAQSVAAWLMVNRKIDPRRIHVSARGAQRGAVILPDDRSVTVIAY